MRLLKKFSKKYDYRLVNTLAFKHKGKVVSSTLIRKNLQNGKLDLANTLLSRTWFIEGVVQRGKKLGKKVSLFFQLHNFTSDFTSFSSFTLFVIPLPSHCRQIK